MFEFIYVSMNENLLQKVVDTQQEGSCLYLFPTRKSKLEAWKLYQQNWDLSRQIFLTMAEWKESLCMAEKPLLKEEKRTLVLFNSMSQANKDFFRIENYHQSIEFAHKFFSFWEEIMEELITEAEISEVLTDKLTAADWQVNTFNHLISVKEDYFSHLKQIDFSDRIFTEYKNNNNSGNLFARIFVVNQFYFTRLEKYLLENFSGEVTIFSQIPENCFNEADLSLSADFNAEHIRTFLKNKIDLYISSDPTQMIAQLTSNLEENEKATIIDFQLQDQPYAHLLSQQKFSLSSDLPFAATRIFRFFQAVNEIIKSLIWEGTPFLISLQSLLNFFCKDDLLAHFVKDTAAREKLRSFLFQLSEEDYKFIDLESIQHQKTGYEKDFTTIFLFLQEILKINSINELIEFIEMKTDLKYLLTDQEDLSTFFETFFAALADFSSIEKIGLNFNWNRIFPQNKASNLILLFLNYLKPLQLRLVTDRENKFNFTTLQNTRNLSFTNLYVLNVIEGILPDRKHTQYLFSENQRKKLGLKTYDDITLRDKYYFYRLLAASENVTIFTRVNLEENIEISSFLEELALNGLINKTASPDSPNLNRMILSALLKTKPDKSVKHKEITKDFFAFPFRKIDFPDNKLSLSFYKWEKLQTNPFEFYLEFILGIKAREFGIADDLSSKLIGNLAHEIINLVWKRILQVYDSNSFKHNFIHNTRLYVAESVDYFLKHNNKLKYLSAHNFSDNYFQNIFIPILKYGIENFFFRLHNELDLSDKTISVFPETGKTPEKFYFSFADLEILLRGRPDLRIQAGETKYIFDFKTGNNDNARIRRYLPQLQFYELISYLLDAPENEDNVRSFLFFMEQKDLRELSKRIDLEPNIREIIQTTKEQGFCLTARKDTYENVEITRRDLLNKCETVN